MASELTGRDLDAAVGKALGFEPRLTRAVVSPGGDWVGRQEIWPRFSTDWAAAGLVIEEMRRNDNYDKWRRFARFCDAVKRPAGDMPEPVRDLMLALTPELICRAALEATDAR
jgi:hypothetical protein